MDDAKNPNETTPSDVKFVSVACKDFESDKPTVRFLAAALSDLAPKLLHCYRKQVRYAHGGIYRQGNSVLTKHDFDTTNSILRLMGYLCKVTGTRRSFSSGDIRVHEKATRIGRPSKSEIRLYSKQHYGYRLDSMEEDDMFSSACTSCQHKYHYEREKTQWLDIAMTINTHMQLQYFRDRILNLYQALHRFAVDHEEYVKRKKHRVDFADGDSNVSDKDDNLYIIVDPEDETEAVIPCKKGLAIADVETTCGEYVTNFERILRVYKWLKKCEKVEATQL